MDAQLTEADLTDAQLEGASLFRAQLEGASLFQAQLQEASLFEAQLQGADLSVAQLRGAELSVAHLQGAQLSGAQLEGADLTSAYLQGADLFGASFDKISNLYGAHLNEARLDLVILDNTNLTVVPWREVTRLGEELDAAQAAKRRRPQEYRAAARTYRALSVALLEQGIKDATRFRHQAEVMERKARWWDMKEHLTSRQHLSTVPALFAGWLLSGSLDLFTGYGHRIERLFATYALIVCVFAAAYFVLTGQPLTLTHPRATLDPRESVCSWPSPCSFTLTHPLPTLDHILNMLAFSAMAFHGRGILAADLSLSTGYIFQPRLHDLGNWLGGLESIFGLLIEGLFVAVFARRVTGG